MKASPFPQGLRLPDGSTLGRASFVSDDEVWVHKCREGGNIVLAGGSLPPDVANSMPWQTVPFAGQEYHFLKTVDSALALSQIDKTPSLKAAKSFARALAGVSAISPDSIFLEEFDRLITFSEPGLPAKSKARHLGAFLTGGVDVSADDVVALRRVAPWVTPEDLCELLEAAAITPMQPLTAKSAAAAAERDQAPRGSSLGPFELAGRRYLSEFFNEHVIDIVRDEARYAAMGVRFPGGIILEGPTGCGKTYAVERLVEHLGWPSFSIEASSVASPYIHETSRKVAEVFSAAMKAAPSVVIIDEMDAFLASRDGASHQHNVEEVAEFLRRIPEASANRVLVIGMTNQIDAIDAAILRRGRFDHVIHVDHAGEDEVSGLLRALLADIPHRISDIPDLAKQLAGRPLSDASFVVREAGRLAAKARKAQIEDSEIKSALARCPSRNPDDRNPIGF